MDDYKIRIQESNYYEKAKESISTFDRWMQDPEVAKGYQAEYREFVLSELLLAIMDNDEKSVRELAKHAGISANTIQNIRSGHSKDMKLSNFISVAKACGYGLVLEKNGNRIPLTMPEQNAQ